MVPSTYEDGTLYNVLPSGNKAPDETGSHNGYDQTRADFTFDRGNNLAATRVNADGLIEKGRENLLTYSNDFSDSDWEKSDVTITSGFEGYDGTNNAWELTRTATAYARMNQAVTQSGVYTHSIYAKAGSLNWISIGPTGGGEGTWFNLSDGTIGIEGSFIKHSSIESVENGWYRISVVVNNPGNQWFRFYPSDVDGGDQSATATGTIYVQNAQLEKGLVSTPYIETGATTAKAGILEDMPRIDYTSGTGALLLEPLRTNLASQSELLDDTYYSVIQSSVTNNNATSPEGVQNAALLKNNSGDGAASYIRDLTAGMATSTTYTTSIFAKYVNCQYIFIRNLGVVNQPEGYFDIQNGVVALQETGLTGDIEPIGTDGWYRCSITGTTASSISVNYIDVGLANDDDGTRTSNLNQSALLYGLQNEAGNYVSSYIPTYGSAVSRSADSCKIAHGEGLPTAYPFVLYAEAEVDTTKGSRCILSFLDEATTNRYYSLEFGVTSGKFSAYNRSQGVVYGLDSTGTYSNGKHKIAVLYSSSTTYKMYVDGSEAGTKTHTASAFNSDIKDVLAGQLRVSSDTGIRHPLTKTAFFNEALSDSELATLTTL